MNPRRVAAAVVFAAVVLAGCAGPSVTTTTSTAVLAADVSTEAPAPPAALGVTQTLSEGEYHIDTTVFEVRGVPDAMGADTDMGGFTLLDAGAKYVAADVKVCSNFAGKLSAMDRWSLIDNTDARYQPTTENEMMPAYPYAPVQTAADECLRGWVMFEVRQDAVLTTVRYSPTNGSVLRWAL